MKEYSSYQAQASPGEVRSASAGEYFDQPLTNSAVRRLSTESPNRQGTGNFFFKSFLTLFCRNAERKTSPPRAK